MFYSLYVALLILAFILFVATVILFFVWNIPSVHAELSGKRTRERIRKLNNINKKNPEDFSTSEMFFRTGPSTSGSLDDNINLGIAEEEEDSVVTGAIGLATNLFSRGRSSEEIEDETSVVEDIPSASEYVEHSPEYDAPYDGWAKENLSAGDETPKPPSFFPTAHENPDDFNVDSETGVFDDTNDDIPDSYDGGVFSKRRRVIVVEEKTNLSR